MCSRMSEAVSLERSDLTHPQDAERTITHVLSFPTRAAAFSLRHAHIRAHTRISPGESPVRVCRRSAETEGSLLSLPYLSFR